jgi:hypothetical protein
VQPHDETRIPLAKVNGCVKKIAEFEDTNEDVSNAICLNDGKFAFYASLDRVNKVSGKLVVTLV